MAQFVIFKSYLKSETETALGQRHSCLRLKLSEDAQVVLSNISKPGQVKVQYLHVLANAIQVL